LENGISGEFESRPVYAWIGLALYLEYNGFLNDRGIWYTHLLFYGKGISLGIVNNLPEKVHIGAERRDTSGLTFSSTFDLPVRVNYTHKGKRCPEIPYRTFEVAMPLNFFSNFPGIFHKEECAEG
jgi:hypothetical protein